VKCTVKCMMFSDQIKSFSMVTAYYWHLSITFWRSNWKQILLVVAVYNYCHKNWKRRGSKFLTVIVSHRSQGNKWFSGPITGTETFKVLLRYMHRNRLRDHVLPELLQLCDRLCSGNHILFMVLIFKLLFRHFRKNV
jgi:hypothetical protein